MIEYKGFTREDPLRVDVLVQRCILLEAKAVEKVLPIHKAQLLSYMKLLNVPVGLLINFHEMKVTDGIYRLVLPGANRVNFPLFPLRPPVQPPGLGTTR
jgi:GxxExxY protein